MVVRMRVYVSIRSIFVKGMPDLLKDNHEPYIVVAMLPRIEGEHHITTAHERRYEAHVWKETATRKDNAIVHVAFFKAYYIRKMVVCIPPNVWNFGKPVIWNLDHSSVQRNQNEKSKIKFLNKIERLRQQKRQEVASENL